MSVKFYESSMYMDVSSGIGERESVLANIAFDSACAHSFIQSKFINLLNIEIIRTDIVIISSVSEEKRTKSMDLVKVFIAQKDLQIPIYCYVADHLFNDVDIVVGANHRYDFRL